MAPKGVAPLQFMDGVAGDSAIQVVVAGDLQTGNFDLTRLCYRLVSGQWKYFDIPFVVVSVEFNPIKDARQPRMLALGRDGRVWFFNSGVAPQIELITDGGTGKGKYGYLSQIKKIADRYYVCGDQGQVYVRRDGSWQHMDQGLLHPRRTAGVDIGLNGIDGTGPNDIYVVGDAGAIFHFDGTYWSDVGIDTSLDLERVRCVDLNTVYICGDGGILLTGSRNGWRRLAEDTMDQHLWDVEIFAERIYVAADAGLFYYEPTSDALLPVATRLSPAPDGHRLSTNGRELWSIGENHLARFANAVWELVVHPDNVP